MSSALSKGYPGCGFGNLARLQEVVIEEIGSMIKFEPETSPSLLLRIRDAADTQSWQTFEEVYSPVIRNFCRRRGIQEADIDDLVQDVMASVAKAIRQFDYDPERGRFRAWFGKVTNNRVKSFLRMRATRGMGLTEETLFDQVVDPELSNDWDMAFCQQVFKVSCDRIKHRFEASTWTSFEMTWVQNIPAAEVASQLGLPIHTIYVNKSRVLKQLEAEVRILSDDFPASAH